MKQYQINRAYMALDHLAKMQLPARDAFHIYMLAKQLEAAYQFELQREKQLIEKHGGTLLEGGVVAFPTPEAETAFKADVQDTNVMDADIQFNPIEISLDAFGAQTISPVDIACLDGFVSFSG